MQGNVLLHIAAAPCRRAVAANRARLSVAEGTCHEIRWSNDKMEVLALIDLWSPLVLVAINRPGRLPVS